MTGFLQATGQRVTVIIATDGESSDGDIAAAMAPLKDLPVWVVIRLCTDEDKIVDYWNNIDKVLGMCFLYIFLISYDLMPQFSSILRQFDLNFYFLVICCVVLCLYCDVLCWN